MKKLSNITIKEFREMLTKLGLEPVRTVGGHEIWRKQWLETYHSILNTCGAVAGIYCQEYIRDHGMTRQKFLDILESL